MERDTLDGSQPAKREGDARETAARLAGPGLDDKVKFRPLSNAGEIKKDLVSVYISFHQATSSHRDEGCENRA